MVVTAADSAGVVELNLGVPLCGTVGTEHAKGPGFNPGHQIQGNTPITDLWFESNTVSCCFHGLALSFQSSAAFLKVGEEDNH